MPMLMKNSYVGFLISFTNIILKSKNQNKNLVYPLYSILDILSPKMVFRLIPRKQKQLINAPYPHVSVIFRYFYVCVSIMPNLLTHLHIKLLLFMHYFIRILLGSGPLHVNKLLSH